MCQTRTKLHFPFREHLRVGRAFVVDLIKSTPYLPPVLHKVECRPYLLGSPDLDDWERYKRRLNL